MHFPTYILRWAKQTFVRRYGLSRPVASRFLVQAALLILAVTSFVNTANSATAQGTFVPVPLPDADMNNDLRYWSDGARYNNVMSGFQTFSGVPFEMRTSPTGQNIIWATSANVFSINRNTVISRTVNVLSTNGYGTRAVYTLINSAFGGGSSSTVGSITFVADDGTSHSVNLVMGQNVRDHYFGGSLTSSYVELNVFGIDNGSHFDMQRFDLPASFSTKTLTSIIFTTTGSPTTGMPFLAGVTLDAQVDLLAKYTMEEQTVWSGASGELKDTARFIDGPFNGRAIGSPLPVQSFLNPARSGAANGTCQYAQLNGPANNGGAFEVNNLPVVSARRAQNSVSFWMYWQGNDATYPVGWGEYKLAFKNGLFGFDAGDGRMFARSATGLVNGWHHVAAIFTNLDMASNKLYIDGVAQTLAMSGQQQLISFVNTDALAQGGQFLQPPAGWFTDNPSRQIEVGSPSLYGVTGATTNYLIEVEANQNDYNFYTILRPEPGEELTLSVDYAGRQGYFAGTNSAIEIYVNNVLLGTMNTRSNSFTTFTYSLGVANGSEIKLEFRSVDRNSVGGVLTNIQIRRDRTVATSGFTIGGVKSGVNNRFIGYVDEVKVYRGGISEAQVRADYADTHQCLSLHHVRLDHNGSGVTCAPTQIAVRGCSNPDLNGICTPSVIAFGGTVVAESNGVTVATAPFAMPSGQSSVLVELNLPTAQTVSFNVVNYSTPPYGNPQTTCWDTSTNTASCQYSASDAGFIVSNVVNGSSVNIANQEAGVDSRLYVLRSVKTNTTTRACEAALQGRQDINFGYVCNNPTNCSSGNRMKIGEVSSQGWKIQGGTFISANSTASGFASTLPVALNFDGNGNASFWLNYYDVGQTTLFMQKNISNGARLFGNSNAFVTKPFSLVVNNNSIFSSVGNITNPAASSAAGPKFIKSGEPFKATVTAYAANGDPTANFGKEIITEGIRLNTYLVAPVGGAEGVLSNNTTASVTFNNGSATIDTLSWSEVGIIRLIPVIADNDYLGAGSVVGVGGSGDIGRFYPDHFSITAGSNTQGCIDQSNQSNQFTYFGQDGLSTAFTITAKNKTNGTTRNYAGTYAANSFMKFNTSARASYRFTVSPSFTLDASATPISGSWSSGLGSITAKHIIRKPPVSNIPAPSDSNITFFTQPFDDDGVTTVAAAPVSAASPFRYGRLFLQSQHGSELLNLPMSLEAQYWDGYGYIRNTADNNCSTVPLSSITMKNYHGNLNACETRLSSSSGTGSASMVKGLQKLRLSAPKVTDGIPNTGSVDLEVNLNAAVPGEKVCLSTTEENATSANMPWFLDVLPPTAIPAQPAEPAGRATFGLNRLPVIYMREAF